MAQIELTTIEKTWTGGERHDKDRKNRESQMRVPSPPADTAVVAHAVSFEKEPQRPDTHGSLLQATEVR
jgi:hypothetical protein